MGGGETEREAETNRDREGETDRDRQRERERQLPKRIDGVRLCRKAGYLIHIENNADFHYLAHLVIVILAKEKSGQRAQWQFVSSA